jgi:hypothetical protein
LTPSTFSLSNGQHQDYTTVGTGSYSVTENLTSAQATAGWTLASLSCTTSGTGTSADTTSPPTVNITMGFGGSVDCTYTNHINLSPTIATTLSKSPVAIGESMHDSAMLTGAASNAGGSVTYHAYAGANTCSGTDLLNSTQPVTNGVVPDSDPISFSNAGTYSFQAVYTGDANDNGATSTCSTEQLVVNKNQPTQSTAQSLIPNDSFTLSGGAAPVTGSITFNLYSPSDPTCSGLTPAFTQTVTVSGNGAYSTTNTAFSATAIGEWRWQDSYTGNANNKPVTSACGVENFTIVNVNGS